ncbi:MAG: hypothetical protein COB29_13245 [Sulfitobacter sp.]|nr:MAG: hypothetical protein COB29_13245 [Sulfitobacter sp.]
MTDRTVTELLAAFHEELQQAEKQPEGVPEFFTVTRQEYFALRVSGHDWVKSNGKTMKYLGIEITAAKEE